MHTAVDIHYFLVLLAVLVGDGKERHVSSVLALSNGTQIYPVILYPILDTVEQVAVSEWNIISNVNLVLAVFLNDCFLIR